MSNQTSPDDDRQTPQPRGSSSTFEESEEFNSEMANSFLEQLVSVVNLDDVNQINQTQKNMLNRFEKTNEMLVNVNALGQIHYEKLSRDYRKHTTRLTEMHKDLDSIFHRIRFLKQKLKQKYPDIKIEKGNSTNLVDENEDDEKVDSKPDENVVQDIKNEQQTEQSKENTKVDPNINLDANQPELNHDDQPDSSVLPATTPTPSLESHSSVQP